MVVNGEQTPGQDPFVQRMSEIRERGLRVQAELGARLSDLEARLGGSSTDAARATATLDARGFPAGLTLEIDGSPGADQIRAALTTAFLTARTSTPTLPVEAADALVETIDSASTSPDGPAAALAAHGVAVSNDLGQATVTALFGDVVAIEAADAWLSGSRPDAVAEDILALAQRAARASDRFSRFTTEETHG